ncbi:MAG: proton-conducting membrane transporter [Clostridiales bacterium]|nr:proton-conducting membrane transporter [Clostridiales bacterium]
MEILLTRYLYILILLPIFIGILVYFVPKKFGIVLCIIAQVIHAGYSVMVFISSKSNPLLIALGGWNAPVGIELFADNLSAVMVLLVSFLFLILLLFNIHRHYVNNLFLMLFLIFEGLMCAIFLCDDLFTIFVMVEVSTIVVSLLIMSKRDSRSMYDGMIYLLVNIFSMTFFLFGLAMLYKQTGTFSLRLLKTIMSDVTNVKALYLPYSFILTSVCLKAALMPLFSWLPKAHGTPGAPSVVSATLSGLYVKGGIYLYLRITNAFYIIDTQDFFLVCGIITAFVGFALAIAQSDIKLILAYHTVSQLGLIMMALNMGSEVAYWGGVYHILSHALFKTVLFLAAGMMIEEYKTRNIHEMHGVFKRMPWVSGAAICAILGITGAPFFNGSISKYLISHGSNNLLFDIILIIITLGTLISFVKFLKVFTGNGKRAKVPKLRSIIIVLLGGMCLLGGLMGADIIEILFGYSAHVNASEYTLKAGIFIVSVIASYFIYFKLLKGKSFLSKIRDFDIGINGIALSIVIFFAVLTGYLYII